MNKENYAEREGERERDGGRERIQADSIANNA